MSEIWRRGTPSGESRGSVVIADPDDATRRRARDELQSAPDLVVAADVGGGVDALELFAHYQPDIALLETQVPPLDGIAMTRKISDQLPGVRVLIHTSNDATDLQLAAFRAGAMGLVMKGSAPDVLPEAARALLRGTAVVPRRLDTAMVELLRSLPDAGTGMRPINSSLTPREWEVADLLAQELTTGEIATQLVISEETVYTHVKHVFRKFGVHSREEAIAVANRMRLPGAEPEVGTE